MKSQILLFSFILLFLASCSSAKKVTSVNIATGSEGVIQNKNIPFPLYLTNKIEDHKEIEKKLGPDCIVIHTGHILKATNSKEANENILKSLKDKNIDAVNLSMEDFIIADKQGIQFENYPQMFLNSSVIDLNEDSIVTKPNVKSYLIKDNIALVGISDKNIDPSLSEEKFMVSDYVLAILRSKKTAIRDVQNDLSKDKPLESFVIIHTIKDEINDVMDRLPPSFINSQAN